MTSASESPRVSPVWLVLISIGSVQFGAAIAKHLFDEVPPAAMVWLRLATSAVVLMAWARPQVRGRARQDWLAVGAFALTLGGMNWAIYESFAQIPLGIAVTLEFTGPLLLAVAFSRRARDLLWVLLAAAGVALLGLEPGHLTATGVVLALVAGSFWAGYIVLTRYTGQRFAGVDSLALASVVAAVLLTPYAVTVGGSALLDARILALGAAIGMLSSVIPYSCEMVALRTLSPATFSILMSLEPAAAALAGAVLLHEFLTPLQLLAVVSVVAASVGATRSGRTLAEPVPD